MPPTGFRPPPTQVPGTPRPVVTIPHPHGGRISGNAADPNATPHHTTPKTHPKGTKLDANGLPAMPSDQELRASANAQAWKSISSMIAALPSVAETSAPYDAQRAAIKPLVDAHKDWLLKAGEYQTQMANGIAQLVYKDSSAIDAQQQGAAGAAGAPTGTAPLTNVSPSATSIPAAAFGGSFANYLHALEPYATAMGVNAIDKVGARQQVALTSLGDERAKVSAQYPILQDSAYSALSTGAVNSYKGEIAALALKLKGGQDQQKIDDARAAKIRELEIQQQNADTNAKKLKISVQIQKLKNSSKTNTTTDKEKPAIQKLLAGADATLAKTGGTKAPGVWGVVMKLNVPKPPTGVTAPAEQTIPLTAGSQAELQAKIKQFMHYHPGSVIPGTAGAKTSWSQQGVPAPVKNTTGTTGGLTKDERYKAAWAYLLANNKLLPQPLSQSELQNYWRTLHPLDQR